MLRDNPLCGRIAMKNKRIGADMTVFCYLKKIGGEATDGARAVMERLERNGLCCVTAGTDGTLRSTSGETVANLSGCGAVISIGGDGTALRAAKAAIEYGIPLLGINAGRLGHLCAVKADEAADVDEVFLSRLTRSERTVISAVIDGREEIAVNDISVSKDDFGATVTLEYGNGRMGMTVIRGDGLVIATPTGSTAYSLSAGGPILSPEVEALAITPICPHGGASRPVIVPDSYSISVSAPNRNETSPYVYADGIKKGVLKGTLTVYRNEKKLVLLTKNTV